MKKLLAMLVVAMGVSTLFANQYYYDDTRKCTWELSSGNTDEVSGEGIVLWSIVGCDPAPSGSFAIPARLGTMNIWGVGNGEGLFANATNLTSITIEAGVKYIAANAFAGCANLATVEAKGELENVDTDAFAGTKFAADNQAKGIVLGGVLVKYAGSELSYTVPDDVKIIADLAFASVPTNGEGILALKSVNLGKNVETIGAWAFRSSDGVFAFDTLVIPDSVKVIKAGAFISCAIKNLTLGAGIEDISGMANWFDVDLPVPYPIIPTADEPYFGAGASNRVEATELNGFRGMAEGLVEVEEDDGYYVQTYNIGWWRWTPPADGRAVFRVTNPGAGAYGYVKIHDGDGRIVGYTQSSGLDYSVEISSVSRTESYLICVRNDDYADVQLRWDMWPVAVRGGLSAIESVNFGNAVAAIPYDLFNGCESLGSVTFGDGLRRIGSAAFQDCTSLSNVNFSAAIEVIGYRAFENTALGAVAFGAGLREIDGRAFYGCETLSNVNFTAGIESIGDGAFQKTALEKVDLSACSKLKVIPDYCFAGCANLREVTFNGGLETIGDNAFAYDNGQYTAIATLKFPESLKKVGDQAFYGSTNLSSVVFNEGLEEIGLRAFSSDGQDCYGLTSVDIPESVEVIGGGIFSGSTNLWTITGGEGVVECAYNTMFGTDVPAFECKEFEADGRTPLPFKVVKFGKVVLGFQGPCKSSLTAEDFGDAEEILSEAFWYTDNVYDKFDQLSTTNLISVTLPATIRKIGFRAFSGAENLSLIGWPADTSAIEIGDDAFKGTKVGDLKGTFRKIGASAFENCLKLASVDVTVVADSEDLRTGIVGDKAFYNCTNLQTAVVRAYGVESFDEDGEFGLYGGKIGNKVFAKCFALTQATIEADGTVGGIFDDLQTYLPSKCQQLQSVSLDMPAIQGSLCTGLTNLTTVAIGDKVGTVGSSAFSSCSALATVTGCASVKAVYDQAFAGTKFFEDATQGATVVGSVLFRYVDKGDENGELVLPDTIAVIAANAFKSNNLAKVTIPATVEKLEAKTFVYCPNLVTVVLKNNEIMISGNVCSNCEKVDDWKAHFTAEKGGHLLAGFVYNAKTSYYRPSFEKLRFHNDALADGDFVPGTSYTGWILDGWGGSVGTVTVKTGKLDKNNQVKVTASVQLSGLKKNYTAMFRIDEKTGKAVLDDPEANWFNELKGMFLGGNWLSGGMTIAGKDYTVRGGNDKNSVESFDAYAGHVWVMALASSAWEENIANANGFSTLTVTPAKKGKIKVSGMMADGTKVSATAQMVAGDNGIVAAPVTVGLYAGKRGGFSFLLQFYMDGGEPKMWFDRYDDDGPLGSWYLPYVHEDRSVWTSVSFSEAVVGEVEDIKKGTGVTAERTYVYIDREEDGFDYAIGMLARKCETAYEAELEKYGVFFGGEQMTLDSKGKWTFAKQAKASLLKEKDIEKYADELAKSVALYRDEVENDEIFTADGKKLKVCDAEHDEVMGYWTPTAWMVWDIGSKLNKKTNEVILGENTNWYGWGLKYTPKTGAFNGSSLYYWVDLTKPEKPALKNGKFAISGVVIDGKLYGSAVVKGVSSFAVTSETLVD